MCLSVIMITLECLGPKTDICTFMDTYAIKVNVDFLGQTIDFKVIVDKIGQMTIKLAF